MGVLSALPLFVCRVARSTYVYFSQSSERRSKELISTQREKLTDHLMHAIILHHGHHAELKFVICELTTWVRRLLFGKRYGVLQMKLEEDEKE